MKRKGHYFFTIIIIGIFIYFAAQSFSKVEYISQGKSVGLMVDVWSSTISASVNTKPIEMYIDGVDLKVKNKGIFMDSSMTLMVPAEMITEAFDCSVSVYNGTNLVVEKGNTILTMSVDNARFSINGAQFKMSSSPVNKGGTLFVPLSALIKGFGYTYTWDVLYNRAVLTNDDPSVRTLPYMYSYIDKQRNPIVKNQGVFSTCWATAALAALESSVKPEMDVQLAVDHMVLNNSFKTSLYDGGEYTMALAYLTAWQGPVYEKDDPYGDRKTDNSLQPVLHVQEAQIIKSKDLEAIKEMVYKYGGVQSSLYTSMQSANGTSKHYNKETNAYCYIGEEKPNHDVVIIGWDDNYPKENFNADIDTDGAFICQNSWGDTFGNNGIFYVSYVDANIGVHNIVYTGVESIDNYDNIYQTDLCGWQGILGYETSHAYFANVYTAKQQELLKAVGFYATDVDTSYTVYVATNIEENSNFSNMTPVASGTFKNAGFYTVKLDKAITLSAGKEYAVIVRIDTPNSKRPVAVEMAKNYATLTVDLSDGKGYISVNGTGWERVEDSYDCNICLKAYTDMYTNNNVIEDNEEHE